VLEWTLHAGRQARAKKCVERGDREGATRAEKAFLCETDGKLQGFRAAVELSGEKFV
jgi:hypothetical protein